MPTPPTGNRPSVSTPGQPMSPGDEAPEGTSGTGENICPVCDGRGSTNGIKCTNCDGTGKVTVGIGGA